MIATKRQRQSNLELLRILSMMLVMLVHYLPLRSPTTAEMLSLNPIKALMNLELHSIAIICVHCFILISGYFGIRWKAKSFFGLIFQLIFWGLLGLYLAEYFINPFLPLSKHLSLFQLIVGMFTKPTRWFVSAYLFLYILSPLINSFVEKSTEHQLTKFILIFYLFSTIYGWIMRSVEFNTGLSAVSLMGLYLVGAWLRKSTLPMVHWSKWYDLAGFMCCTILLTGVSAILLRVGIRTSIYGYLNPVTIVEAAFLFQFFRKLDIGSLTWVNFLAGSAFAAFLLHSHNIAGEAYYIICTKLHQYNYALIYVMVFIIAVFLFAVLVDKIRMVLWNGIVWVYSIISQCVTPPYHAQKSPHGK